MDLSALEAELKRDPTSRRFGELAREYQRLGRMDEARELCERGLLKHPTQWQARLLLAQVYLAQGRVEEAGGCVEKILLALPENVQANHLAADIHLALGDRAKALKHYQVVDLFEPGRAGVSRAIAELTAAPAPPPAPEVPEPEEVPLPAETAPQPAPVAPEVLVPAAPAQELPVAEVPAPAPEPAVEAHGAPEAPPTVPEAKPSWEEPIAPTVPPSQTEPPDDFMGTVKIPTWTAEPEGGAFLEDVDQTAPAPVLSVEENPFGDLSGEGADSQLGEEFLDAHEQTLTELPRAAAEEVAAAGEPVPAPAPAAARAPANPLAAAVSREASRRSAEGPSLSTTTLAALYAEQGYPEKAIEVYQRVLLQDPERSDVKRKIQELMQRITGEAPELPEVHQEDVRRALRQRRVQVLEGWLRRVREERHV